MSNTTEIYAALQSGADDEAINELIRAMLSTGQRTADNHDIWTWRRDNYLDLRRWAYPSIEAFAQAQTNIAAGGVAATEGEAALSLYYAARLTADLRFPFNPYVPDPDPVEPYTGDE